jgi:hypothetical protein
MMLNGNKPSSIVKKETGIGELLQKKRLISIK